LQLALKTGGGVACAFEGLRNFDLDAFCWRILRQNYQEATSEKILAMF